MDLVGVTEIARMLGVTGERVRQLAKEGKLPEPVARIGRQNIWRREDVEAWRKTR